MSEGVGLGFAVGLGVKIEGEVVEAWVGKLVGCWIRKAGKADLSN